MIAMPTSALVSRAFHLFASAPAPPRVRPSIPILYFGDCKAYAASPLRVITVAVNPSNQEFPNTPCLRFPNCAPFHLSPPRTNTDEAAYLADLDAYFAKGSYPVLSTNSNDASR
jgi:hypothetical protein